MPTLRQKTLAEAIVANKKLPPRQRKNKKELVVSSGYGVVTGDKHAGEVIAQKGVKDALREFGLTEELITTSLVADIKAKPKKRERELKLGAEILGMTESEKNKPNQQNNFFIFNDERATKIARRIVGGASTDNQSSQE